MRSRKIFILSFIVLLVGIYISRKCYFLIKENQKLKEELIKKREEEERRKEEERKKEEEFRKEKERIQKKEKCINNLQKRKKELEDNISQTKQRISDGYDHEKAVNIAGDVVGWTSGIVAGVLGGLKGLKEGGILGGIIEGKKYGEIYGKGGKIAGEELGGWIDNSIKGEKFSNHGNNDYLYEKLRDLNNELNQILKDIDKC
jgi:vacuolar-type H+-ATPase subunit I/STV1